MPTGASGRRRQSAPRAPKAERQSAAAQPCSENEKLDRQNIHESKAGASMRSWVRRRAWLRFIRMSPSRGANTAARRQARIASGMASSRYKETPRL
jgi:hypothetical protein